MTLNAIPFEEIGERHLFDLVENQVPEDRALEYKREIYGNSDSSKAEYLADISAFANGVGGDLIIGIEEEAGVPKHLQGVSHEINVDSEIVRLESMARTGIQPRLIGMLIKGISLRSGRQALIIRVRQSLNPPHRVIFQGKNRFWIRSSGGRFEPNVDELRPLFSFAPRLTERLRDFRVMRIESLSYEKSIVDLQHSNMLVLHVAPLSAFINPITVPARELIAMSDGFRPMLTQGAAVKCRLNMDGLMLVGGRSPEGFSAYTQVWRDGRIEAVRSGVVENGHYGAIVRSEVMMGFVGRALSRYLAQLSRIDITPPYAIFVTLIGVTGASLNPLQPEVYEDNEKHLNVFDRNIVMATEVIISELPEEVSARAAIQAIREALDEIANASNLEEFPC